MSCEILMVCGKHVLNAHARSSVLESHCSRHCCMHRTCNYSRKPKLCVQSLVGDGAGGGGRKGIKGSLGRSVFNAVLNRST